MRTQQGYGKHAQWSEQCCIPILSENLCAVVGDVIHHAEIRGGQKEKASESTQVARKEAGRELTERNCSNKTVQFSEKKAPDGSCKNLQVEGRLLFIKAHQQIYKARSRYKAGQHYDCCCLKSSSPGNSCMYK